MLLFLKNSESDPETTPSLKLIQNPFRSWKRYQTHTDPGADTDTHTGPETDSPPIYLL